MRYNARLVSQETERLLRNNLEVIRQDLWSLVYSYVIFIIIIFKYLYIVIFQSICYYVSRRLFTSSHFRSIDFKSCD